MPARTVHEMYEQAIAELIELEKSGINPDKEGLGFVVTVYEWLLLADQRRDNTGLIERNDLTGHPVRLCGLKLLREGG